MTTDPICPQVGDDFDLIIAVKQNGVAKNISTTTSRKIKILKPGSTTALVKDGEFVTDGADGKMKYHVTSEENDTPGNWCTQGYGITWPDGRVRSTKKGIFEVGGNL